jgi:hypothetical protein
MNDLEYLDRTSWFDTHIVISDPNIYRRFVSYLPCIITLRRIKVDIFLITEDSDYQHFHQAQWNINRHPDCGRGSDIKVGVIQWRGM